MPDTALLDAIRRCGRRARPADRCRGHRGLHRGLAAAVSRPHAGGDPPRQHRRTGARGAAVRRGEGADRAAGRQHIDGRWRDAGRGRQRVRAEPVAADACPRHRSARSDHDDRGRRHAEGGTDCGGRGGMPAAAVDLLGGQRADRRRAGHQCRRQQHGALWQCARSGAGAGGCAAGRHGVERTAPAAQGQHRLLPAPVVRRFRGNAGHHHCRGAEAGAAAARGLRGAVRAWPRPRRRWSCSAASSRTIRRRSARSN